MGKSIKTIAVMTSGGDSPGMNAAIRSVVRTCAFYEVKCIGIYRGYEGLMESDFIELDARSVKGIINKGGTILKSARSKAFRTKEGRQIAYKAFKEKNIFRKWTAAEIYILRPGDTKEGRKPSRPMKFNFQPTHFKKWLF